MDKRAQTVSTLIVVTVVRQSVHIILQENLVRQSLEFHLCTPRMRQLSWNTPIHVCMHATHLHDTHVHMQVLLHVRIRMHMCM